MKRVRITEFYLDFDKLRKGAVTKEQFRRVLSMQGFELTEGEYQALEEKYHNDEGHMNYVAFCNAIDSVFTLKGIDKDPTAPVKMPSAQDSLQARRKRVDMDEAALKKLYDVLKVAAKLVLTQRVLMKPFFQAFDVTQCGYVTKTQFSRVLAQVGLRPTEETQNIILKYYMDKGNLDEVNYVDFVNDVDKPESVYLIEEKDFSLDNVQRVHQLRHDHLMARTQVARRKPEDVEDVLALIRRKVKEERMRLSEFLRDFDKLRCGAIPTTQFRIGLNMGKIELSNAEFDALCEHFAAEPGKVRWRDFVDKIEEVFTTKALEQSPTLPVTEANTQSRYGKLDPSSDQVAICTALIDRFSYLPPLLTPYSQFLVRDNLDIKSFFQEWDRHRHFKVSPKQFRQVLASCKFTMTNEEFDAVVAHYKNPSTGEVPFLHPLSGRVHEVPTRSSPQQVPT